jgi:hypothetical protein
LDFIPAPADQRGLTGLGRQWKSACGLMVVASSWRREGEEGAEAEVFGAVQGAVPLAMKGRGRSSGGKSAA